MSKAPGDKGVCAVSTWAQLLRDAISLAVEYHGTTTGKDGALYVLHPLRIMTKAETTEEKIVAVLHDTIEDTDLTLIDLASFQFPRAIIEAIDALTRRKDEEYSDFIERIALNPLATKVKLLDLYDNIDLTRLPEVGEWGWKRTSKYHAAIKRLEGVK